MYEVARPLSRNLKGFWGLDHLLNESSERSIYPQNTDIRILKEKAIDIIKTECKKQGVTVDALQAGSRRRSIARIRAKLASVLVDKFGLTLAEVARLLGVTTSAVTRAINRTKHIKYN